MVLPHSFTFVILVLLCLVRASTSLATVPVIPKCCQEGQIFIENICTPVDETIEYSYYVYDSNETHIQSEPTKTNLNTNYTNMRCPPFMSRVGLTDSDVPGFIYNASAISLRGRDEKVTFLSPEEYCMEYRRSNNETSTIFLICYQDIPNVAITVGPTLYIVFLFISTGCFFGSAFMYYLILGTSGDNCRDVHKKCFLGYSLSMGSTFLFLIILQKVNSGCTITGSLCFVFALSSFVWLSCLCADLIIVITNFKNDTVEDRLIYLYLFLSVSIPTVALLLSTLINGEPGIPNTFIKGYWEENLCKFKESNNLIFFIPATIMILTGLACIIYSIFLTRKFNSTYRNHFDWIHNKQQFRHMLNSNGFLLIISTIWLVNAMLGNVVALTNQLPFDMVESLQGIFTIFIFVFNKHTRQKMVNTCGTRNVKGDRRATDPSEERELRCIERQDSRDFYN